MGWHGDVLRPRRSAVVGFALTFLVGASGSAATAYAAPVLPDLDQAAPSRVVTRQVGTQWQLAFDSTVVNVGSGNLRLLGDRPDTTVADMTVSQIVDQSDGSTTSFPNVGTMRYVRDGGHEHWHVLDFEHFELTTTSGTALARDQKQGFCLWQLSVNDCGLDEPNRLEMPMGIAPGGSDRYTNDVAGNSVDISGLASGDYLLIQRANPSATLQETTFANNASSARIRLRVLKRGQRKVQVLATCADRATC